MPRKKKTNITLSGFLFFAVILLIVAMMTCKEETPTFNPVEVPVEIIEEKVEEVKVKLDSVKKETINRLKEALPKVNIDSLVIEKEESVMIPEQPEVVPLVEPVIEEPADTVKTEDTIQETQKGVETNGK
tara:strand:+ start:128 stop:517 length:390 start_codon:yes stop_codon:yes gene_type:complete